MDNVNQMIQEFADICRERGHQEKDVRLLLKEVFLEFPTNVGEVIRHLSEEGNEESVCIEKSECVNITETEEMMCVIEIPERYLMHIDPLDWQDKIIQLLIKNMED